MACAPLVSHLPVPVVKVCYVVLGTTGDGGNDGGVAAESLLAGPWAGQGVEIFAYSDEQVFELEQVLVQSTKAFPASYAAAAGRDPGFILGWLPHLLRDS